jgi:6-phosphogluconate dehydrogenase (decarboxylating)
MTMSQRLWIMVGDGTRIERSIADSSSHIATGTLVGASGNRNPQDLEGLRVPLGSSPDGI